MKVLIACEKWQRTCSAFRAKGHEAYSCDILPSSGGHPEWHVQDDVLKIFRGGCDFVTEDGQAHRIDGRWDLIIAHPPCTFLTVTGNRWFDVEKYGQKAVERLLDRQDAIAFFMKFVNAPCDRIAIENPVGVMSTVYQKPTQIIQPYWFGDPARKATCLWLKGLPELKPTNIVKPDLKYFVRKDGSISSFSADYGSGDKDHSDRRSMTYPGIAQAFADQWG